MADQGSNPWKLTAIGIVLTVVTAIETMGFGIDDAGIALFVRDRGSGFDPGTVPSDRRGVRESIVGRMERAGGRADIRSSPGGGTEVAIEIARSDAAAREPT